MTGTILGLESSCDDTAAAILRFEGAKAVILSSVVWGQSGLHAPFGGIVPEIAARAHAERLDLCIEEALNRAGLGVGAIDGLAVTAGPGLIGGLIAGVTMARALATVRRLPLVGVNHLAGHALTPMLTEGWDPPYLLLLVSGGHCQFLAVEATDRFRRLGGTIDDAPGEAFDKAARLLGLGQPGGPEIERAAASGDPGRFALPRPLVERPGCDMSFSGLKTALLRLRDRCLAEKGGLTRQDQADLSAAFQAAVAGIFAARARNALAAVAEGRGRPLRFAVSGGVAANRLVRARLAAVCAEVGAEFTAPPLELCTDNAAMIAYAGGLRLARGEADSADLAARPRWPLDAAAAPMLGSGRRGAKA